MGIIRSARQHYGPLPYHNWDHAEATKHEAIELLKVTRPEIARRIDPRLLQVAAFWHDAGYDADYRALGVRTHEHHAAALARRAFQLSAFGAEDQVRYAGKVREMIMATHEPHERTLTAPGGLVLHLANLANMMQDEERFMQATRRVFDEKSMLSVRGGGSRVSWAEHQARTIGYMEDIWPGIERELDWLAIPDASDRLKQLDYNIDVLHDTNRPPEVTR